MYEIFAFDLELGGEYKVSMDGEEKKNTHPKILHQGELKRLTFTKY